MKEKLYIDQVASDLIRTVKWKRRIELEWRLEIIIPLTLLAYGLWQFYDFFPVFVVIFTVPAYNSVRLILSLLRYKRLIRSVSGEDVASSITFTREVFSHASEERIFAPSFMGRWYHWHREVPVFCFRSGVEWQMPVLREHYPWSNIYNMPEKGLYDTTLVGDEMYLFTLNADREVRYAYNARLFMLSYK